MKGRINGLGGEYASALRAYLTRGDETALSVAYELGRRAMGEGLGVLDMATLHQEAFDAVFPSAVLRPASAVADPRSRAAASGFFHELLSPFEMSFRGYREANDQLKRLSEMLRGQKEAIELVNRELESFSYSVSHDLRAPLRRIDGFSQALLEDCADKLSAAGGRYVGHIRESVQEMAQLIDDLLALARVATKKISRAEVDLTAIARRIAERLKASAPQRAVRFVIGDGMRASGDPRLLAVVLENLLGNAFKFTSKREGAEIEFGSTENRGRTAFFVRDNGAGFDMAYSERLFGAFQRLHAASDFEGTGIGLATVQRVVLRHEGQVWAEGLVNAGASFYFTLGAGQDLPG